MMAVGDGEPFFSVSVWPLIGCLCSMDSLTFIYQHILVTKWTQWDIKKKKEEEDKSGGDT